jgi:hypothetical protein
VFFRFLELSKSVSFLAAKMVAPPKMLELAVLLELSSVPLFEVNRFVDFRFEKMPIPLKMLPSFLSLLKRFAKGLAACFYFGSYSFFSLVLSEF